MLLLVLGLILLIERVAGYRGVLDRLRTARPEWLGVALAAETVSLCGFVASVRGTLGFGGGPRLGYRTSGRLVLASLGATRAVAGGGPAGIAVFYWAFRKAGASRDEAARRVFALYALVFAVFAAGTWLCALALVVGAGGVVVPELTLPWLLGAPLVIASAASIRAPAGERWLPGKLGRWLRTARADAAGGVQLVRRIVTRPHDDPVLLAGVVLYWLGDVACLWTALHAFGVSLAPSRLVLAYSTAYLTTLLPLPLGGVGSVEAAATVALRAVGVPIAAGLLAVVAYRAVSFWLPTLPGLVSFATLGRLGRRMQRGAGDARESRDGSTQRPR